MPTIAGVTDGDLEWAAVPRGWGPRMRLKALALDVALAALLMGVVFTPILAALSLLNGSALLIGCWITAFGIVGATFWVRRRFDIPFPPWRTRRGRVTPGKRRYQQAA